MEQITTERHPIGQYKDGVFNTISGRLVNLENPTPDSICIEDIAASLSKICRFNGHVYAPWSVAQHSLLVLYLVTDELQSDQYEAYSLELESNLRLKALLHDGHEAYMQDMISPLKYLLGEAYKRLERGFINVVAERFGLPMGGDDESFIKRFDLEALEMEHKYFQKEGFKHWQISEILLRTPNCNKAEDLFLSEFHKIMNCEID